MAGKEREEQVRVVQAEQRRLKPLKAEAQGTVLELMRAGLAVEEPAVVPVLSLGTVMGIEAQLGSDGLRAFALALANMLIGVSHDFADITGHSPEQLVDFYQTELMAAAARRDGAGPEAPSEEEAAEDERAELRAWCLERMQLSFLESFAAHHVVRLMSRLTDGGDHDVPEEALSVADEVAAAYGHNGLRVLAVSLAGWAYGAVERTAKMANSPLAEAAKGIVPVFSSWPVPGPDGSMG
ncbi:hypothetical protein I5Q34_32200 [Streptomyces sp. AV19]|uniref:hypothetical protein n=1 Tax=Streptomyces sp. AV19 TaxID=2793068 RepID=UPI0018FE0D29|nr:hypothetical protein [Streptomyces sp. AV19]MBH1938869.1 hypothetical protein [Streptomyces sp. AV19]MDG4533512.1 hypothetical protein [Streptomyces sp. AV19]